MDADTITLAHLETVLRESADRILNHYFEHTTAEIKTDGSIVTEADTAMQKVLRTELERLAPDVVLLGEEMTSQEQQNILESNHPYWCLDPVDGTNNFHHGVPLYSVSLALVVNREVSMGLVYDPVRGECFSAQRGSGLRLNGAPTKRPQQPEQLKQALASVDFKRLQPEMRQKLVASMPFKSQRNVGSCALEWAWLAAGRTHLLLHGGEKLWDYAAGSLLLSEAGGCSSDFAGNPVFNHSLQARPVVGASNAELYQLWLQALN